MRDPSAWLIVGVMIAAAAANMVKIPDLDIIFSWRHGVPAWMPASVLLTFGFSAAAGAGRDVDLANSRTKLWQE